MPLSEPIIGVDGTKLNEIVVPKGTPLFLGLRACNRNKAIWGDDALEWKPERWLQPLPESVGNAHIPGIYSNL
jgi:cytochrome P450